MALAYFFSNSPNELSIDEQLSGIEENLTQYGKIMEEVGTELIHAYSSQAKGKVEKKNDTIQGRLINDIKRKGISTYLELNTFFNDEYAAYLNHKFSYEPAESETEFVPLGEEFNLLNILCIKEDRTILDGSAFSINNNYYQLIDSENVVVKPFRGTSIVVMKDVFDGKIKAKYREKIYTTRQVHGHRKDSVKRQFRINNQKELDEYLRNQPQEQ